MEDIFWVDTHCHLDMIEGSVEEIMQRATKKNVRKVVSIGTDQKSNEFLLETVKINSGVFATLGIHPHEANHCDQTTLDFLHAHILSDRIVAVGECGLDYFHLRSDAKNQQRVFEQQLELAVKNQMPVVVHTRNAEKDTMEILKNFDSSRLKILLHCFTSNLELAEFARSRDYYFSFNGIATFKKSDDVRAVLQNTPKNRILLETDSPYLAPNPVRKKKNEPAFLAYTGEILAEFLGLSTDELKKLNMKNAQEFYKNFIL